MNTSFIAVLGQGHSLSEDLQFWGAMALMPVICYALGGRILGAQSPGGKLSWTGRRWLQGMVGALVLWELGLLIAELQRAAPATVTVPLWVLLGCGGIVGVRWLWRDWKKEQQAREAYFQKLAHEGKAYVPPQVTGANKVWRWVFNAYAIILVAAGLYSLVRYLLHKF